MKRSSFFLLAVSVSLLTSRSVFAQWEPDRRLTFNDSASYTSYNNAKCVAASGSTVHVVWYDLRNNINGEIYYKRSTDRGMTWSQDTRFTNDPNESWHPSVWVSGSNVHVVWMDDRLGWPNWEIYYKRSTDRGTTWSGDIRLTNGPSESGLPSVWALGSNVHLVWQDSRDGGVTEIYYKRSTDGGATWSGDARLTNDPAWSRFSSVSASGTNVHVVWDDQRDGSTNPEIYYKRSSDGGTTWSGDIRLTRDPERSEYAAVTSSGTNVHVVWEDTRVNPLEPEIYYKRSTDGGTTWSGDIQLTYTGALKGSPSISSSGPNVHVVWHDKRTGDYMIYYKLSLDGGMSWSGDLPISTPGFNFASLYPSLAFSDTMVHVVWWDLRDTPYGPNPEIYYTRNPTGNPSGVEENTEVRRQRLEVRLKTTPNPFTSFARIPGHEAERFALYDIAGRRVGTYKGDRIGEGLKTGVYFLRPKDRDGKPLPIVKVR